jgi:hypothetical protein
MSMHIRSIYLTLLYLTINSLILVSCNQQETRITFIVPLDTMPVYNTSVPKIPPPNRAYYLPSNFIIDSTGNVFYYQQKISMNDDEVRDWDTPPNFINLKPIDIVQIPVNSIEEFVEVNILNSDTLKRYVSIASEKDTITSLGLSKIVALFNKKSSHIRWKFRIATQEELIVLDHKKRQVEYYPNEIRWDSTKIRMTYAGLSL